MSGKTWILVGVTGAAIVLVLATVLVLTGTDPRTARWAGGPGATDASGTASTGPSASPTASPSHSASASPSPSATTGPHPARWTPKPGTPWQWQLSTPVDLTVDVPIYDIDGFTNDAGVVRALHQKGRKVICYVEVGSAEDYRPDYHQWPTAVLGKPNGWPGERWVDVRAPKLLDPVLSKRFDMCRDKGFDAVEPDIMDGYANDTGFPISAADQLAFNRYVARLAHDRGLSVALKNDVDQVGQLAADFDFSVDEECFQYQECDRLSPFVSAGKAVLHVEYASGTAFCATTTRLKFSSMRKNKGLDAARWPC